MITLFFSYSHKDEEMRNELETHLALLKRQGFISSWHDRRIAAGKVLDQAISRELDNSQIILLLISANFLASDYCYEKELTLALEKHANNSAVVIPVILHPCDWHSSSFGHLRATPTDGKPVSMYANQQEAFALITKDIRAVSKSFSSDFFSNLSESRDLNVLKAKSAIRSSNLRIKKQFDDHEKDEFLEDSYEYMARFFEGSLQELSERNPQIKTRFKRFSQSSFAAFTYERGERIAECSIWYGSGNLGSPGIVFSQSGEDQRHSFNEYLSVIDDGLTLQLKPMWMQMDGRQDESLSQEGGAEYFWSLFIRPLQE